MQVTSNNYPLFQKNDLPLLLTCQGIVFHI